MNKDLFLFRLEEFITMYQMHYEYIYSVKLHKLYHVCKLIFKYWNQQSYLHNCNTKIEFNRVINLLYKLEFSNRSLQTEQGVSMHAPGIKFWSFSLDLYSSFLLELLELCKLKPPVNLSYLLQYLKLVFTYNGKSISRSYN